MRGLLTADKLVAVGARVCRHLDATFRMFYSRGPGQHEQSNLSTVVDTEPSVKSAILLAEAFVFRSTERNSEETGTVYSPHKPSVPRRRIAGTHSSCDFGHECWSYRQRPMWGEFFTLA